MKIYPLLMVLSLSFLFSCAHRYPTAPAGDEVIATSNGKERPDWAMEKPRFIKGDQLFVSGMVEVSGDQSPARGLIAADLQAKANLVSELQTRLKAQLQFASEGFSIEQQRLNNIITESIDVKNLSGMYIDRRFFEKVQIKNSYYPQAKYACYSLATIPLDRFKEAVARNLKDGSSEKELSDEFKEKVEKAWKQVFDVA